MILSDRKLAAELMFHYMVNKTNDEIFKFLDENTNGSIFAWLHNYGTSELGKPRL